MYKIIGTSFNNLVDDANHFLGNLFISSNFEPSTI